MCRKFLLTKPMHMGAEDTGVCQLHAISEDGVNTGFGTSSGEQLLLLISQNSFQSETLRALHTCQSSSVLLWQMFFCSISALTDKKPGGFLNLTCQILHVNKPGDIFDGLHSKYVLTHFYLNKNVYLFIYLNL